MILFGLLIGLGAISSSVAHQADTKVTLTVQGTSVKNALNLLGSAAHVSLLTSPQTANEILTFRFVDVPLSEAMRRIADIEFAEWKQDGEAMRLVRSAKLQRGEQEWETNRQVQAFAKAIALRTADGQKRAPWSDQEADRLAEQVRSLIKDLPPGNPPPPWRKRAEAVVLQSPISRALQDILCSIDPGELAGLPLTLRTVWSTRPTKTQRSFSPKLARIVDQYLQDEASWIRSVESHSLTAPEIKGNPHWSLELGKLLGNKGIATILLAADQPGIDFTLTAYDDAGKQIAQASDRLQGSYSTDSPALKTLFPDPSEKPIEVEGDDRLLYDYSRIRPVDERGPPPAKLLERLLDTEQFDPLHLSGSSMLVRIAEVRNVNMIGRLPDKLFDLIDFGRGKQFEAATWFSYLPFSDCQLDFTDGWISVRPYQPVATRDMQADRRAFNKYMHRLNSDKPLSIDEQARVMAPLPEHQMNDLPWRESTYLNCPDTRFFDTLSLRFYAAASAQQKERMMGDGMPLSSLTSAEREIVNRMVYGRQLQLIYSPTIDPELSTTGILSEATEALPNGLPPDGLVTMRVSSDPSVFPPNSGLKVHAQNQIYPNMLVMVKYAQDHPEDQRPGSEVLSRDLKHFLLGKRTTITITFQFTPTLSMAGYLQDGNVTDLKPITFDQLPQAYLAEFDKTYQDWAKMMSLRARGITGKSPPP